MVLVIVCMGIQSINKAVVLAQGVQGKNNAPRAAVARATAGKLTEERGLDVRAVQKEHAPRTHARPSGPGETGMNGNV